MNHLAPLEQPLVVALFVHAFMPDQHFGTENYTLELARGLQRLGHRPTIIAATFRPLPGPVYEEIEGVPVIRLPVTWGGMRENVHDPSRRQLYLDLLGDLRPDVVHICHFLHHTTAVHAAADALGIPLFATLTDFNGICHMSQLRTPSGKDCSGPSVTRLGCIACGVDEKVREAPDGSAWKLLSSPVMRWLTAFNVLLYRPFLPRRWARDVKVIKERLDLLRPALNRYRAAIAPVAATAERYRANGITAPIIVSHFGVDIDRGAKPVRSSGPLRVGYIGQIAPHKGLHILLEALHRLEGAELTLCVHGPMDQLPRYTQTVRDLAGSQALPVTFAGGFEPDRMAEVLADIDLLVMPSLWRENSPLTLLAALATHTPVIVSDVGGMRDFIEPGRNGVLFPRGRSDALAAVLRDFLEDRGRAARMSLTTHYERTSLDMVQDILNLYRESGVERGANITI